MFLLLLLFVPLKVRADTTLTEGEWSDEVVILISEEVSVQDGGEDSNDNLVAYVVGCLLGAVAIIIMIGLLIFLVHIYRNRIKYHGDTFVST